MFPDPRQLWDLLRSGGTRKIGQALRPERAPGFRPIGEATGEIKAMVVRRRAEWLWPDDAEAREGYCAYYAGAGSLACPYHAVHDEEDWRGWKMGWACARDEDKRGADLATSLSTAPGRIANMRRLEGYGG